MQDMFMGRRTHRLVIAENHVKVATQWAILPFFVTKLYQLKIQTQQSGLTQSIQTCDFPALKLITNSTLCHWAYLL